MSYMILASQYCEKQDVCDNWTLLCQWLGLLGPWFGACRLDTKLSSLMKDDLHVLLSIVFALLHTSTPVIRRMR